MAPFGPRFLSKLQEWAYEEMPSHGVCFVEVADHIRMETTSSTCIGVIYWIARDAIMVFIQPTYEERQTLLLFLLRTLSAYLPVTSIRYDRNISTTNK